MHAVFVALNASYSHSALALYILKKETGSAFETETREYTINQPIGGIVEDLYLIPTQNYFFSVYLWNVEMTMKICELLKKVKDCTVTLGGSEVSYRVDEILQKHPCIDYIVSGEAEGVITPFLDTLTSGANPSVLDGVYAKGKKYDGRQCSTRPFAQRKFPYSEDMLPMLTNRILYYETSRGCPYRCSYCISSIDKTLREVPLKQVQSELLFFINHEIPLVKFVDRTFNANSRRAEEIVRFILEHNKKTSFHFEICADTMSDELIRLLRSAPTGYFQVEAGLQSINPPTLRAIHRNNRLEDFRRVILLLTEKQNMHVHADLIACLPNETLQTFIKAYDFLYDTHIHMLQLGFLKILSGTRMHGDAQKYGMLYQSFPPYEVYETSSMKFADKIVLRHIDFLTDRIHNSGKFTSTLGYFIPEGASAYVFFDTLRVYFEQNRLFDRALSLKELYLILLKYAQSRQCEDAVYHLAFDYLRNVSLSLPDFFTQFVTRLKKEDSFEFFKNGENIRKYLPFFAEMPAKEIFKHAVLYSFKDRVYLFCDQKEQTVFRCNRYVKTDMRIKGKVDTLS